MIEQSVSLASNGVVKVPGYEQLVRFGYTKNKGVYRLNVTATGEWEGLTIRAFWHLPGGKDPASSLVVDGYVDVPASVTAQPGNGCITFEGSDGTKTVTSADLRYRVSANSGTEDGTEPEPGTPAWQQLVDAVHTDATAAEQAKTDAQTAAQQSEASAKKSGQALSDIISAKEDALKAIGDKQTTATQAVDIARDKALQQVEASTEAAQTAASEATTSAGDADRSAQEAAGSLQELKDGIANGNFKGEPGNDGKSPVVTVTDIENGHRVSITDKDGTKTIDVLNGKDGKDAPQIDDTAITESAPWSSKHIVDMLCPPLEETGNPAQFYPVAGYPLGCKVSWEPTQEGTGDPSPENVRPIKGRDSVAVKVTGKNLLKIRNAKQTMRGVTISATDGLISISGTATETGWAALDIDLFDVPGTVILSSSINSPKAVLASPEWKTVLEQNKSAIATDTIWKICFTVTQGETYNLTGVKLQLELGSTATTYSPYTGQTTALTLPHTIYGGTVDAVTGEGQETRKLITLDGTEAWTVSGKFLDDKSDWYYVSSRIPGAVNESPRKGNEICSHYPHADVANNNAVKGCAIVWGAIRVRWGDTIPDNADGWKSYLSAQYAAGTPVQVAYKLAEPIPFTATGAQPIPALSGANTVLTDADKLTVTGRADPIKRITDLEDAVASMTNT